MANLGNKLSDIAEEAPRESFNADESFQQHPHLYHGNGSIGKHYTNNSDDCSDSPVGTTVDTTENTSRSSRSHANTSVRLTIDSQLYSELARNVTQKGDDESSEEEVRQTALCCGSCCDLVRACIIVNSMSIFLLSLYLSFSLTGIDSYFAFKPNATFREEDDDFDGFGDDDFYADEFSVITDEIPPFDVYGILGILQGSLGILFSAFGIWGATHFSRWIVLVTGIFYFIFGISLLLGRGRLAAVVVAVFFAYPHFHLFSALLKEEITSENYKRREQHCCCREYDN